MAILLRSLGLWWVLGGLELGGGRVQGFGA